MTSTARRVSVIIGTKNRPDTLREALASIRALEGPDLTFEILVGDNGTNPETRAAVAGFDGLYGQTHVNGCPAARNVAMRKLTGEFVAFLDDDDVFSIHHIRPHIALMDARPDIAAVFGQVQSTDASLNPIGAPWPTGLPDDGDLFRTMLRGYFPQVGGTVVRASVASEIGLMDESLIGDSDWDWQLRIAKSYKIGFVPVVCVLFRQRPPGSFDKLQMTRVGYTRRIFWRHAWAERRRWNGVLPILRDYFSSVQQYYDYFHEAALDRASAEDWSGFRRAVWCAVRTMPHRTVRAVLLSAKLRRATAFSLLSRQREGRKNLRPDG